MLCLMHPGWGLSSWLPGHAAGSRWACCQQHLQIPFCRLLSSHSLPIFYLCLVLLHPRCRIWHLVMLNFIPLIIAQCSNLSRCLCKACCLLQESTAPPSLVLSTKILMVHSTPASRSLIKILNRTGPGIEPWGALLVTGHHPDVAPNIRYWHNHTCLMRNCVKIILIHAAKYLLICPVRYTLLFARKVL